MKSENRAPSSSDVQESKHTESTVAALRLQKVYRSYRTRRSTISFFNFSKPETAASRWSRISMNASKVGKGLCKDNKAQKLAFQHWIEAIDPRHRYGHNLNAYYEEWCKADAGQPFFFWLDIGDGKEVDLKECPRSKLQQQCIIYLGPKRKGSFHHSSFLAGGATLAAGRFMAECGKLKVKS
ncbi:hypothetical protein HYC85_014077 [Camellia sinensis]|uniref:IQ domain-containing protein IQM3-like n=1 Tax=Camellia sinensis TaxID=4442 RepID=A0A7J7H585_CAMSI|nr:hypothetical protein HYC85_014077 [Camellia sinensis]